MLSTPKAFGETLQCASPEVHEYSVASDPGWRLDMGHSLNSLKRVIYGIRLESSIGVIRSLGSLDYSLYGWWPGSCSIVRFQDRFLDAWVVYN